MAQPLSGRNPLSYLGVEAITPPNMIVSPVSPTPTDSKNVTVGDMWIDRNTQNFFVLTSLSGGRATWTQVEGSAANQFETDDSNIAVPIGGLLVIRGGSGIATSSSGNIVTITATAGGGNVVYVNTTPYVVQPTDFLLDVDVSGGPIEIQLPDVPTTGKSVIIKDLTGQSANNNITVTTVSGGATIDGSASYIITDPFQSIETTGNSQGQYDISLGYTPANEPIFELDISQTAPVGGAISLLAFQFLGQTPRTRPLAPGIIEIAGSDGNQNTLFGGGGNVGSGMNNSSQNTGVGFLNLSNLHNSSNNCAFGFSSLANIDFGGPVPGNGVANCAYGHSSLDGIIDGHHNVAIGYQAGISYTGTESSNILISNTGTVGESNKLRIGSATGTGNQQVNEAFICGIQGVNVGSVASVVSISGDQLGTTTITAGSGITVTPGAGTITIDASGGGGATTYVGDSGTATPSSNLLHILTGYGSGTINGSGTAQFSASSNQLVLLLSDGLGNTILGSGTAPNVGSPGGNDNTAVGEACMQGTGPFTGSNNCGLGASCLEEITTGASNTAMGVDAGEILTTGLNNCFFGFHCGNTLTTGTRNVFMGYESGGAVISTITGSYNVEIGFEAGVSYTTSESSNVLLNASSTSVVGESNTLRIGNGTGTGNQQLNRAFISGIQGINVGSVADVVSISGGQLGTTTITAGTGITVTPGAGTITIDASGSGISTLTGDNGNTASGSNVNLITGFVSGPNANGTANFQMDNAQTAELVFNDSNSNLGLGNSSLKAAVPFGPTFNNTALGVNSGIAITGNANTIMGADVAVSLVGGTDNCFFGFSAAASLLTGTNNIAIGSGAAGNLTGSESSNVYLNNGGTAAESNALRIGASTGTGTQQLNKAFVAGIQGITVTGTPVLISSSDQLGIAVSSKRFKTDIQDMGDGSAALYKLRPVSFTWDKKSAPGLEDSTDLRQFGLIAEEAASIVPHAVNLDKEGKPLNINYPDLIGMMINEIQNLRKEVDALKKGAV